MGDDFFLAQQLKSGKVEAYDFLMDSFYQKLCAYAYTLVQDHSKTEDIVQNVFVRLWINRKGINPNLSIKNFLYKSVYNEFVDQYRKERDVTYLEKEYFERLEKVVLDESEDITPLIGMVNSEIENLPPKCKQVFLLNKKEGLTHIEISKYLNISIKTVDWHITQAFKILREKLNSETKESVLFLLFGFR
ncbi:RNA polymerase sigma factor [Flagellimonas onchidii]|uniref:RNA polymerase sigma factor n=1 Tax=Flagellimonas onchidii TaxID=2562684 RepID=UPI001F0D0E3D|nr:RNA polymerase sigma-70 factor [Allomuricauda onchidii]